MKNLIVQLNALPPDVGIIDSGIGGISALNALDRSGITHVIYVADTAYLPYGEKSYEVLLERGKRITDFLLQRHISTIIVACHTLSSTVLPELQQLYPQITFIDLLFPTVSYAVSLTRTNSIGVLATHNTVQSKRFPALITNFNTQYQVIQQACPQFVPLLEARECDELLVEQTIDTYLEPIFRMPVDTLILGCTHYAFLSDRIAQRLHDSCTLVSAYSCIQHALKKNTPSHFSVDFWVSGALELFTISSHRVLHMSSIADITYNQFI